MTGSQSYSEGLCSSAMRYTKRPRPHRPPPFNPYDIMRMTAEEAAPLLWVPRVTRTLPSAPDQVSGYAVAVLLDEESEQWLTTGNRFTWLELFWYERHAPKAECKVLLMGIDDSNYGAWLTARTQQEYVDTWHKLLGFLDECGAREFGVNGEHLLDYCDEQLGAYERDYN